MRLKFLALGIALIFIGLLFISISQTAVTESKKNEERVAVGEKDSTQINATLNAGDIFSVSYSGGSGYTSPEELDVTVYDPRNESTTVPYMTIKNGIVANYTGLHRMQLLGLFIDPSSPIILTVMKIHRWTETKYPNSDLLPVGISLIIIGTGVSIWGALSSKGRRIRGKVKKA